MSPQDETYIHNRDAHINIGRILEVEEYNLVRYNLLKAMFERKYPDFVPLLEAYLNDSPW